MIPPHSASSSDRDAVMQYVVALRKHLRLLIVLPLTLSVIALAASLLRPRVYAAHAAFLASEPGSMSGSLGALSSVASQLGIPALSAAMVGLRWLHFHARSQIRVVRATTGAPSSHRDRSSAKASASA